MALRWHLTASAFVTLLTLASSQQILPSAASSSFPACGLSCTVLKTAQSTCDSSYPAGTAQLTYENCFCTQSSVQPLYASADGLCTSECTAESDRALLQTWFTSFCKQVGEGINPNTVSSTSASTTAVTSTSTTSSSTTTATSSGSDLSNSLSGSSGPWIKTHWRWVLMLGILVVGLSLLAWLFTWLKRRQQRKTDEQRISLAGFPSQTEKRDRSQSAVADLWGPHQHMHATNGWQYQPEPASSVDDEIYSSRRQKKRQSHRDSGRSSQALNPESEIQPSTLSRNAS